MPLPASTDFLLYKDPAQAYIFRMTSAARTDSFFHGARTAPRFFRIFRRGPQLFPHIPVENQRGFFLDHTGHCSPSP